MKNIKHFLLMAVASLVFSCQLLAAKMRPPGALAPAVLIHQQTAKKQELQAKKRDAKKALLDVEYGFKAHTRALKKDGALKPGEQVALSDAHKTAISTFAQAKTDYKYAKRGKEVNEQKRFEKIEKTAAAAIAHRESYEEVAAQKRLAKSSGAWVAMDNAKRLKAGMREQNKAVKSISAYNRQQLQGARTDGHFAHIDKDFAAQGVLVEKQRLAQENLRRESEQIRVAREAQQRIYDAGYQGVAHERREAKQRLAELKGKQAQKKGLLAKITTLVTGRKDRKEIAELERRIREQKAEKASLRQGVSSWIRDVRDGKKLEKIPADSVVKP